MRVERGFRVVIVVMVCLFWIGHVGEGLRGETSAPVVSAIVPYYAPPSYLELCGEAVPMNIRDVRERFDREFTIVVYSHAQVYLWLKRMERYFPWIEKQLAAANLPSDLKYVAVAESDLMHSAVSPAGAVGPWQFVSATGSNYGLKQGAGIDERYDFERSTVSAFRYLKDLNQMFANWTLAIAGYNCGERRVQDEIKRQKVNSYYLLKLPMETERYVFRILAIKEVLSHPERYGYTLPKGAGYQPIRTDRVEVNLQAPVPVQTAAEAAGSTYREVKMLNPSLVSDTIPAGAHTIKVPEGKGKELGVRLEAVKPMAASSSLMHKVTRGETLSGIASKYHISSKDLCSWNNMKGGDKVKIGQVLKIIK